MTDMEKLKAWRTNCCICIGVIAVLVLALIIIVPMLSMAADKIETYEKALIRAGEKLDAYEQERQEIIRILKEMTEEQQKASSLDNALKTLLGLMGK